MKLSTLQSEVLGDLVEAGDPDVVHWLLNLATPTSTRTALEWRGMIQMAPDGMWRLTPEGQAAGAPGSTMDVESTSSNESNSDGSTRA